MFSCFSQLRTKTVGEITVSIQLAGEKLVECQHILRCKEWNEHQRLMWHEIAGKQTINNMPSLAAAWVSP